MGTRVIKFDDLDSKSEADESITYGLEGDFYEVDLSTGNADKLRAALAPFIKVSRPIQPRDAIRRAAATTTNNGNGQTQLPLPEFDPATVRAWLQNNGHDVSDKGRIPENLVRLWHTATTTPPTAQP
jgi:hypothetical protein